MELLEDKYIGLALAMTSSLAIGTSFVITKKGLIQSEQKDGFEGDGFEYLKNPVWWMGIGTRENKPATARRVPDSPG
jgi:hypothetical protein